jgi:alpha-tubulin suppressor-like RCC1 family protein
MGEDHACGIKADGTAWCWGSRQNDSDSPSPYNQLGDGDQSAQGSAIPVAVDGGATWRSIEVNGSRTCGIKVDGSAWCWGANSLVDASNAADYRGALGTGNTANALVPTAVSGGGTWRELSLGRQHTCGVRADHTLWCWGNNATAQLGDGTTKASRLVPTAVASGGRWLSVAVNDATSCALRDDRSAWCWGSNTFGQLGDGTGLHTGSSDEGLRFQRRPLEIAYPRSWAMLAEPGLGIRRGGSIWRWGAIDTVVQVGDGSWSGSYYIQTTPMPSHW